MPMPLQPEYSLRNAEYHVVNARLAVEPDARLGLRASVQWAAQWVWREAGSQRPLPSQLQARVQAVLRCAGL
eukprot:4608476-Alexandrium_andersonii.AAC.1